MENNITSEMLATIYKRAMEYCIAKFGKRPDSLNITDIGYFEAVFETGYQSTLYNRECEYFKIESLTDDLDELHAERQRREEEQRREREKKQRQKQKQKEEKEKAERFRKFQEYKQEFEPGK